jgi:hypothetical protein
MSLVPALLPSVAGGCRLFAHLGHTLFSTFLQCGEGFDQLVVFQLLFFLADGIFDALGYRFGVQVIHTFLSKAFAHVQADTVGSFLRRGFQLYAGLRITTRKYQANQGHRRRQPMLFHAISLFVCQKGIRVKSRAYQAATTNGYRHVSRKLLISSRV